MRGVGACSALLMLLMLGDVYDMLFVEVYV